MVVDHGPSKVETVMEEMVTDIFENESVFPKLLHMSISIDPDAQQAI